MKIHKKTSKKILWSFLLILLVPILVFAHPGNTASDGCHYCRTNCDYWGEVWDARHCHGGGYNYDYSAPSPSTPGCPLFSYYDGITDSCKCNYGYVVDGGSCVNGDTVCHRKYGYNSSYDSLSRSCECDYGYLFNQYDQCVSRDSYCRDLYGFNTEYDVLSDSCSCRSGYVTDQSGSGCIDGDLYCSGLYGYYSSYDSISETCECDSEYTLKGGRCVEKENNVYFTLLDVDTSERQAIIRSNYDSGQYLIEYGFDCYSFSIERYVGNNIVLNLGTDFDVDLWDKVVLQNDNEVCDIQSVERTYYNSFNEMEEEVKDYFITPSYAPPDQTTPAQQVVPNIKTEILELETEEEFNINEQKFIKLSNEITERLIFNGRLRACPSTECKIISEYKEGKDVIIVGSYDDNNWYKVEIISDNKSGWMHNSLFDINAIEKILELDKNNEPETGIERLKWYQRIFNFFKFF